MLDLKKTTPRPSDVFGAPYAVFGPHDTLLEARVCAIARNQVRFDDHEGFSQWKFWVDAAARIGFWVPQAVSLASPAIPFTFPVICTGYQSIEQMDAITFGAAATLMAINHQIWVEHEAGHEFDTLIEMQDVLRDYVYDRPEVFNTKVIAIFLD